MSKLYTDIDLNTAINKSKIGIMLKKKSIFISTILFSLKMSWDKKIPTASTNGIFLKINPNWFMNLTPPQRIGLLAHEAWHVAFQHMLRIKDRDIDYFNQAADHVINLMLLKQKYVLPSDGLWDNKYTDMSTEQVYELIYKDKSSSPNNGGSMSGDISINNNLSINEELEQQNKILDIIVRATTQNSLSKTSYNALPNEIELVLDKLLNPKLPWHRILYNFISKMNSHDYSFKRPNRRYMPEFYLPSLYNEGLDIIGCAFDISSSVSNEEFRASATEVDNIKQTLNPKCVHLIEFDTKIKGIHKLSQNDHVKDIKFYGRGGTNLTPVFDYFNKPINHPNVLIIFSDLYCIKIKKIPKYPVIWVCINNKKAEVNFGKLIHLEVKE